MFSRETERDEGVDPGQMAGIDRLGRQIVRGATLSDDECDIVVSSPMLYARIRAQIATEQAGAEDQYHSWLGMILAAWRAIPVMAIVAIIAAGFLWFASEPNRAKDVAHPTISGPEGPGPVSACSISAKEECGISTEDVLATMIDQQGEDSAR